MSNFLEYFIYTSRKYYTRGQKVITYTKEKGDYL